MPWSLLEVKSVLGQLIGWDDSPVSDGLGIEIRIIDKFNILGTEVWLTQTVVTTWILMIFITIIAVLIRFRLKSYRDKPSQGQNIVELMVESMDKLVTNSMTNKYSYFGKWFFGIFTFVIVSNLCGLLGFRPPTADLSTTVAITFTTFVLIHFMGVKTSKGGYFKGYLEPVPVLLPLNIISEIATPISLSFRLFGNMLGGLIIMSMIYSLPRWLNFGIPAVLHIYFDIFSSCIQTVIFVMLSMIFIKDKIAD